jgi:hypothetical protein
VVLTLDLEIKGAFLRRNNETASAVLTTIWVFDILALLLVLK